MKTAVVNAKYNVCDKHGNILGTNTITKIYNGINDQDVSMQITYDIGKYGYIDVKPISKEQAEKIIKENK